MPIYNEDLKTIEEINSGSLAIADKHVFVEVRTSNYHDLREGLLDIFKIESDGIEYTVKDHEDRIMLETEGTKMTVRNISTNPYNPDYLTEYDLFALNKKEEVLQTIQMLAFKTVSFGGEQPYIRLFDGVLIGDAEV